MRIAMVGTRGVPARYGGFETCVEEVGSRLVKGGHEVVVYCRTADRARADGAAEYNGMRLVHLPALHRKSLETLSHSALSIAHLVRRASDVAVVFNSANAPFLPVLRARRIPVATHVDGLEWMRSKWQGFGAHYYRLAESMAVRWSDALIADAPGIADYYEREFSAPTSTIAYGAPILLDERSDLVQQAGLRRHGYHLVVARFEPENHVDMIVDGYRRSAAQLPLVVVGAAPYADEYTARIRALADSRVRLMGSVWDQNLLDQLYANSLTYLHGHSVGGTNPSLLRASGAGAATIAYDVIFNRDVVGDSGRFFRSAEEVRAEIEFAERASAATLARGRAARRMAMRYDWDIVAEQYEQLCLRLVSGAAQRSGRRPSGRRAGIAVR